MKAFQRLWIVSGDNFGSVSLERSGASTTANSLMAANKRDSYTLLHQYCKHLHLHQGWRKKEENE
jgi:hypothetical protein